MRGLINSDWKYRNGKYRHSRVYYVRRFVYRLYGVLIVNISKLSVKLYGLTKKLKKQLMRTNVRLFVSVIINSEKILEISENYLELKFFTKKIIAERKIYHLTFE